MVVERPADILPDGVYWIKKKSYVKWLYIVCTLMLSWRGRSLKELNENDTFVISIVWVWGSPTVKSYSK
jgi:hypothetical protein